MKLVVLGTAGMLDPGFNTNFLLDGDGLSDDIDYPSRENTNYDARFLAIDCGMTWPQAMSRRGYDFKEISAVYISHLHADHAGGLEWLGFASYFKNGYPWGQKRPVLYAMSQVIGDMEGFTTVEYSIDSY